MVSSISLSVRISTRALDIMGLDDRGRFVDVDRRPFNARLTVCTGKASAIQELVDEMYDRATEGADGYQHEPVERRALKRELSALKKAYGLEPRI